LQVAVIEYARSIAGLSGAHSTEFDPDNPYPVIGLITEWQDRSGKTEERDENSDYGGTMRLGGQNCNLRRDTLARKVYGQETIVERHRHRYEFNNNFLDELEKAGLVFSGWSDDDLAEIIELPSHPWYLACQFHPEFKSNPRSGHPLFTGFVAAARVHSQAQLPEAADA
jgi:CTP synthase